MKSLVFLQLNELNFHYVDRYIELGYLPNFGRFFAEHGYSETTSETRHRLANPWIQWPTVHTGLDYHEHGVFRLGDIVDTDHPHIYEVLEQQGVSVAALSPFNAKNNTLHPAFFVPDPWTKTKFVGSKDLKFIYEALCEVTDDYAKDRVSLSAGIKLLLGSIPNIHWLSAPAYVREALAYALRGKTWYRAIVCDRLLFDTFISQWDKHQPEFATLFLNGAAHLQHHYLFSSKVYPGTRRNPQWHVKAGEDPLLDILRLYDEFLGKLTSRLADTRLLIATGLHQAPHERTTYYYRLHDHTQLLALLGIEYMATYRLMTEDFVLHFENETQASEARTKLSEVRTVGRQDIFYVETADRAIRTTETSDQMFQIEDRGDSLYVQLKPTATQIPQGLSLQLDTTVVENVDRMVALAQYKNTHHVGTGYFADSAVTAGEGPTSIPLKSVFTIITDAFGANLHGDRIVA